MYILAISKIYEEGYTVYSLTQELGGAIANPYTVGTEEYRYWFNGWNDAQSDYNDYFESIEEDYQENEYENYT